MKAGCGIVNGIPVLIANIKEFAARAAESKVPIVGDDYKNQYSSDEEARKMMDEFIERKNER